MRDRCPMWLAAWPFAARERRRAFLRAAVMACSMSTAALAVEPSQTAQTAQMAPLIDGVVWQPDNQHIDPRGTWDQLGAHDLLVQWTAVDGIAFVPGTPLHDAPHLPDWARIAGEPWARNVIVGLAGRFDEAAARANASELFFESRALVDAHPPVHIAGWYFPVEVDPSWKDASALRPLLDALPRPLWISVYDRENVGGAALADWLAGWLPPDVGVFLQDGVGVYAREPRIARQYADALKARLGASRVRVIAEAFRPQPGGGFRAATVDELRGQLGAYQGYRVYLFDGPHYVSDAMVKALAKKP